MGCAVQDWDCVLDVTNRSEEQVFRKLKRSVSAYRAGYFTFFLSEHLCFLKEDCVGGTVAVNIFKYLAARKCECLNTYLGYIK